MDLKAGATVTPRLRLLRPLGKGGMGSVWVAYHAALKTEVAIKFVEGAAKQDATARARFEREAAIAAKLRNPHVASTYDHGVLEDGTPYIVMELLEGESLQRRLKRGTLSIQETALVVGQASQALGKAHKLGIIHRDVKPGNLFLVDTDYLLFVKLLDFGIAKSSGSVTEEELTKTDNLLGSPHYMSPEQFAKVKSVDQRADLWSLAVVAYKCLTNVPPFGGEAIGNVILAVMQQDYRPVTEMRPELPAALDEWFAKAFNASIDQRYQSAKELAATFVEISRNASVPNGRPTPPPPFITEMTRAAVSADVSDVTTTKWSAADADGTSETLRRGSITEAETVTFAPAVTMVNRSEKSRVLALIAVVFMVAGFGGYVMFASETTETPAVPALLADETTPPAPTVDVQPKTTATSTAAATTDDHSPVPTAAPRVSAQPEPKPGNTLPPPAVTQRVSSPIQAPIPSTTVRKPPTEPPEDLGM